MLIAHAPAGYIIAKTLNKRSSAAFVICSLIFSIWPDIDLLYYYLFEYGKVFHHTYFPHLPIVMVIT
jgi:inner membrane protein